MFRIFLIAAVISMCFHPVCAIEWTSLINSNGNTVYLDKDSIKEYNGYYFYNIKFKDKRDKDLIVTLQSEKNNPLSARIKVYTLNEYESLSGDYENITKNITKNLEPVTYQSTVNTCYREVKRIMRQQELPSIAF